MNGAASAAAAPAAPSFAIQQLNTLDRQRPRDYQLSLDFFAGRQWPVQRRNLRQRRLTFNCARTLVDKAASFLLAGAGLAIDAESPEDAERAARRERVLREIYEQNDLQALDFDC